MIETVLERNKVLINQKLCIVYPLINIESSAVETFDDGGFRCVFTGEPLFAVSSLLSETEPVSSLSSIRCRANASISASLFRTTTSGSFTSTDPTMGAT